MHASYCLYERLHSRTGLHAVIIVQENAHQILYSESAKKATSMYTYSVDLLRIKVQALSSLRKIP